MNIAKIMIPKCFTTFVSENQTVRQGWEIMTRNGYTAIPVIDADQHYIGCVSEGDFLRFMLRIGSMDKLDMEKYKIKELVRLDFCPPLDIDASELDVINSSLKQNFVPIVDSRNTLCGILTRRIIIEYLAQKNGISEPWA